MRVRVVCATDRYSDAYILRAADPSTDPRSVPNHVHNPRRHHHIIGETQCVASSARAGPRLASPWAWRFGRHMHAGQGVTYLYARPPAPTVHPPAGPLRGPLAGALGMGPWQPRCLPCHAEAKRLPLSAWARCASASQVRAACHCYYLYVRLDVCMYVWAGIFRTISCCCCTVQGNARIYLCSCTQPACAGRPHHVAMHCMAFLEILGRILPAALLYR